MFNTPEGTRLLKFGSYIVVILGIFLLAQTVYSFKSTANIDKQYPPSNVITVSGEGEALAVPDIATFTFGASQTEKIVSDAQTKVTNKINAAIDLLKKAGVADKDIQTVGYNVFPQYEYSICTQFNCPNRQTLVGYQVSQTISVKIRNVADAGKILGQLGGTQVTDISGLQFTVDDQKKVESEARGKAIADAKAKADVLADQLGVSLKRIVSFSESGNYAMYAKFGMGGVGMAADAVAPQAAPQVPVGENKITSNVTISYEIR